MSLRPAARVATLRRTLIRELFESLSGDEVNLGLGQVDLPVPDALRVALRNAAGPGGGYGATAGDGALRAAVAASYPGFARGPGDVVIAAGCQQATFAVLGALADPGDEVLLPDPGFPGAARAAAAWGAVTRTYPLRAENGFHLDPDEVVGLIGPATRAIVVISPSNPTGAVEPATTVERLARACAERGIALVIDDTYRDLCWTGDETAPGPPARDASHVVVCGSVSKSPGLAGWRIGWIVARDEAFVGRIVALMQTLHTCPATPTQEAARIAFSDAGRAAARHIAATFRRRRETVRAAFAGRADAGPLEGAFYAWLETPGDAARFARSLLDEERIVVIPGEAFGRTSANRVRVSYACADASLGPALQAIARRLG